jgi:hypothetical protein
MAPEVYKNEAFDRSVDAFSFGLILYEVLANLPIALKQRQEHFEIKCQICYSYA